MGVLIDFRSAVSRLPKLKKTTVKKNPIIACVKEACPHNRALETALEKITDALIELSHTSASLLLFPFGAFLL